jgi:hypothetical protein
MVRYPVESARIFLFFRAISVARTYCHLLPTWNRISSSGQLFCVAGCNSYCLNFVNYISGRLPVVWRTLFHSVNESFQYEKPELLARISFAYNTAPQNTALCRDLNLAAVGNMGPFPVRDRSSSVKKTAYDAAKLTSHSS